MALRILNIINSLETGGAERFLLKLGRALGERSIEMEILVLRPEGSLLTNAVESGITVHQPETKTFSLPASLQHIASVKKRHRPHCVMGWLYAGSAIASISGRVQHKETPTIWNLRHTLGQWRNESPATLLSLAMMRALRREPAAVMANSDVALASHRSIIAKSTKTTVIPNGFEPAEPVTPQTRLDARRLLGLEPQAEVVGVIARYHPMKGHRQFLAMAGRLARTRPQAHFLMAGSGLTADNEDLQRDIRNCEIPPGRLHLLGLRKDVPTLLSALDVLLMPSLWGEGCPNIVGESMSKGIPCVVTDVGDAGTLVGPSGGVVPPGDERGLAAATTQILDESLPTREKRSRDCMERVRTQFGMDLSADHYAKFLSEVSLASSPDLGRR